MSVIPFDPDTLESGAQRLFETAKQGMVHEPWASLPSWRKWRWKQAYMAAVQHHVASETVQRPPRSSRTLRLREAV